MQVFPEASRMIMNRSHNAGINCFQWSSQICIAATQAIHIQTSVKTITGNITEFIATNNKGFKRMNYSDTPFDTFLINNYCVVYHTIYGNVHIMESYPFHFFLPSCHFFLGGVGVYYKVHDYG